ncbi:hypothetical protein COL922a_012238 [Colletotrichum nupharicola]|nr:hypothetical protein COL922a_012238 [Colletotrichum nupharicola]
MSWAIDQSDSIQKTQEAQETQLREAITMAEDHGILLFCANPDKNKPGNLPYKSNKTYPKSFCIGAATPNGKPWERIHQRDQSCDFILPGVKLRVDIPELVTTSKRQGAGKPPKEWHDHSGSSLSCALAAGLAAMVLHCTLVNGLLPDGPEWTWLRSRDGMRKALQNISEEPADERGLWLHVRSVFGEAAKTIDSHQKMMRDALRNNVVEKLLRGSPRLSRDGPGDSEPAPRLLKKRATIKDEKCLAIMDGWDDDDSHFEGAQPIIILDDDRAVKKGAELKFEFVGTDSSEFNTDNIIDEDIGGGALRIQWDMTKVVHGKLKPDGPPATLIVFQFVFLPHGSNNRFKNTTITVTFSAGKVLKISPDNQWTTLPSERQQERSHTISPGIEAALGPAKATTSYTWQQKETETIKGHAKVTGEITGRPYKL